MMLAVLFFLVPLVNAGGISLGQTRVVIFEGGNQQRCTSLMLMTRVI